MRKETWQNLHPEVLWHIIGLLDSYALLEARRVCRDWRQALSSEDAYLKLRCHHFFTLREKETEASSLSMRELYWKDAAVFHAWERERWQLARTIILGNGRKQVSRMKVVNLGENRICMVASFVRDARLVVYELPSFDLLSSWVTDRSVISSWEVYNSSVLVCSHGGTLSMWSLPDGMLCWRAGNSSYGRIRSWSLHAPSQLLVATDDLSCHLYKLPALPAYASHLFDSTEDDPLLVQCQNVKIQPRLGRLTAMTQIVPFQHSFLALSTDHRLWFLDQSSFQMHELLIEHGSHLERQGTLMYWEQADVSCRVLLLTLSHIMGLGEDSGKGEEVGGVKVSFRLKKPACLTSIHEHFFLSATCAVWVTSSALVKMQLTDDVFVTHEPSPLLEVYSFRPNLQSLSPLVSVCFCAPRHVGIAMKSGEMGILPIDSLTDNRNFRPWKLHMTHIEHNLSIACLQSLPSGPCLYVALSDGSIRCYGSQQDSFQTIHANNPASEEDQLTSNRTPNHLDWASQRPPEEVLVGSAPVLSGRLVAIITIAFSLFIIVLFFFFAIFHHW
jgi:WD40 repeat protein